jgi:hypothetical protein
MHATTVDNEDQGNNVTDGLVLQLRGHYPKQQGFQECLRMLLVHAVLRIRDV